MEMLSAYTFLFEAGMKSIAVVGAAYAGVALLRGKSAAVRHMVWSAAFGCLLALPLLTIALPALRVRGGWTCGVIECRLQHGGGRSNSAGAKHSTLD